LDNQKDYSRIYFKIMKYEAVKKTNALKIMVYTAHNYRNYTRSITCLKTWRLVGGCCVETYILV